MVLFWIVRDIGEEWRFFLQEAATDLDAIRRSGQAGFAGTLVDVIQLDVQTATHVTRQDIGRAMSMGEARDIIENGRQRSANPTAQASHMIQQATMDHACQWDGGLRFGAPQTVYQN